MTITLEIKPEVEAQLARQAERAGQALERYAADLLEDAAEHPAHVVSNLTGQDILDSFAKIRGLLSDEEIDSGFRRTPSFSRPVHFE
jgi:hypothetical protein